MYAKSVIGNRSGGLFGAFPRARALALAAVALCYTAATVRADIIWIEDTSGTLGTVNLATDTATVIGSSGNGVVLTDIAFDASGNLWGIDFNHLYTVNKSTGHATLVGTTGLTTGNGLVFGSTGTLYASNNNASNTYLYTINTTTAAATALTGSIGYHSAGDLAFDLGTLYMSDTNNELVKISLGPPVSGTQLGAFGGGYTDVYGLATGSTNILYGVGGKNGNPGSDVFTVNTTTGAAGSLLYDYSTSNCGLGACNGAAAIPPGGGNPTPEPSTLVLSGMGLVGLVGYVRRRRRAA